MKTTQNKLQSPHEENTVVRTGSGPDPRGSGNKREGERAETSLPALGLSGEVGGWISVKDRLPEYGQIVLMWFVTVNPANSGVVLGSRSIHERGKFWDGGGIYRDFSRISHWQPLPAPPEKP